MNKQEETELIARLRGILNLNEDLATDKEILAATKGTLFQEKIELGMAMSKLWKEIRDGFWKRKVK